MEERTKGRGFERSLLLAALGVAAVSCGQEVTAPSSVVARASRVSTSGEALISDPDPAMVSTLIDSFSIGGVYTVLPTGGYGGGTTYSTRLGYAETISRHPTGIVLPAGLPVRLLAQGVVVSTATAAFQSTWCPGTPDQSALCSAPSISYSVQGLVPGPGVGVPYQEATGLRLHWSRLSPFSEQYWSADPAEPQLFRGVVPGGDTITTSELHFRRSGCCYFFGTAGESLEDYDGSWRFGAVPDDGGRPELGVPAEIVMYGPRTDAAMDAPATFRLAHVSDFPLTDARWWYITPASNTFDGTVLNAASPGTLPRYPDDRRTIVVEVTGCAGQTACVYQAAGAGALVARVTAGDGTVRGVRNAGANEVAAATLELTCVTGGRSVTGGGTIEMLRGERIDCTASVEGGDLSSLTVIDWRFEQAGSEGYSTSRAASNTLSIEPTRWGGPLVLSGRISVLGLIAGDPIERSASVAVQVLARDWTGRLPAGYPPVEVRSATEADAALVPVRPTRVGHLAVTQPTIRRDLAFAISTVAPITEGPNYLLSYFTAVPLLLERIEIVMNDEALRAHSDFWRAQRESAPTISLGRPQCTRSDVTSSRTRQRILSHEGDQFQPGSHTQRFRAEYQRLVGPAMEQLVLPETEPAKRYRQVVVELDAALDAAASVTDSVNAVDFGCDFTFLPEKP